MLALKMERVAKTYSPILTQGRILHTGVEGGALTNYFQECYLQQFLEAVSMLNCSLVQH